MPPHWLRWTLVVGPMMLVLFAFQLKLTGRFDWGTALAFSATDALPWLVALPVVLWLGNRFPVEGKSLWRHLLLHIGLGLLFSVALPMGTLGLWRVLGLNDFTGPRLDRQMRMERQLQMEPGGMNPMDRRPPPDGQGPERMGPPGPPGRLGPPPIWRPATMRMPFHWLLYALVLTMLQGWRATSRVHARERRATELESLLVQARLTSLSRQLHPHFLFNTLNAIVEFVRSQPAMAEEMLVDLSELLRHALRAADRHVVPLVEELELLDRYLAIQRARFGTRLLIDRDIESQAMSAGVPVLLLQPLVENALEHGLDHSDVPVTVTLSARVDDGRLRLEVRDDAPLAQVPGAGEGIGLENIRQRLAALYGSDFEFTAGPTPSGGFVASFVLPERPGNIPHTNQ